MKTLDRYNLLPLSFSSLNNYKNCPRQFKYTKLDKIPEGPRDMTALLKGGAVHDILEKFPETSNHKLAKKYFHIAENFIKSELGMKYIFTKSSREYAFGLDEQFKELSFFDKSAIFRGKIDHICIIDNVLHVIDWKTGKYREEKWQDYDQLLFYSVFLFEKYNVDKIRISFVYVEHNIENPLVLLRENLDSYKTQLKGSIQTLLEDKEFKKNPTKLCNWCPFQKHCQQDIT